MFKESGNPFLKTAGNRSFQDWCFELEYLQVNPFDSDMLSFQAAVNHCLARFVGKGSSAILLSQTGANKLQIVC